MTAGIGADNSLEVVDADQIATRLQPGQDYYPQRFSASARVKGPIVFAGFGITAPALSYDDYRGDSVKGDYEKMEKIARLVHQLSWDLAQQTAKARSSTSPGHGG